MFKAQNQIFYVFMHSSSKFCVVSPFSVCVCIFMCAGVHVYGICMHRCVLSIILISMFSLFDILSYIVFVFFVHSFRKLLINILF